MGAEESSKLSQMESLLEELKIAKSEFQIFKHSKEIEDELLEASLNEYEQYLEKLDVAKSQLDGLLANTASTLEQLSEISASFRAVDSQTRKFQEQSANVLQEQKKNEILAKIIAENLQYYEPLERMTRRLNAPGAGNLARSKDFSDMLVTMDECIDYMQTHTSHKEAEMYRSRYKLLLTRGLTLIRNTFMSGVREITSEVSGRIAAKQLNDTTMSALLYAKFRVGAGDMKELGLEIQKRANPPADAEPGQEGEYQSLMNELHASFAACRARLVLPIVHKKLHDIAQSVNATDLVQFSRTSISYIRGICLDEFELWGEWFHGQRGLYDFLESICEPLYDHLRPRIIHENRISKLCSLVTLLQTRYLHDEEEDGIPDLNQLDFSILIQPALEDAQSRLVFRAQAILRDEIEFYKPKPEDLDYPRNTSHPPTTNAPLSGKRVMKDNIVRVSKRQNSLEQDSGDEGTFLWTSVNRNGALQNCYPTLLIAVQLLARIYRLLNSSVFDDLAHQIVHQTTISLHTASTQISSKSSPADGQLFLLRHLLLLKSQIVAFDIEYVTPDVAFDFSGVASTFYELRERGGLFNPTSWMRLFSTGGLLPRVIENMLDAKVELDGRLRTVINDFTASFASDMTKELPSNIEKLEKKTIVAETVLTTREHIEKEVPILRAKLEQYLDDMRTRETLVAAVEDQVVQVYETFFDAYVGTSGLTNGGMNKSISRKGKSHEDEVWDIDTFAEWAEVIFNVALPSIEEDAPGSNASRSVSPSGSL